MALNHYESVKFNPWENYIKVFRLLSTLSKMWSKDPEQHWDWSKCRILGPAQLLWSRISILTGSSGDFIHLKVWQALLSGTGEDKKRNYKSGPKCEGISGIRRLDDDWRGTRRVNCNSKELKGGFLQHELWLGEKKKKQNRAWQLLDIRKKKKNKLRKNVEGRKKKNQFLEAVTLNFFRPKNILFHWKSWGSSASSLLLSDKIDDS